jgi:hypothetical protein
MAGDNQVDWLLKVGEVSRGEVTPSEAEHWAEENGSKTCRLEFVRQAAADFDAAHWPFFLAAAWVAFREQVRAIEAWTEHRLWGQHSPDERLTDAARTLIVRLREGKLVASGIEPGQQERTEISALNWVDLTWERWASANVFTFRHNGEPNYVEVFVPSPTVRKLWKPKGAAEEKMASSIAAENACEAKLIDIMRKNPTTPATKEGLKKQFAISARSFDRAYAQAVKKSDCPAWGAAGRRKSPRL